MSDMETLIQECIQLQELTYTELASKYESLASFNGKTVRLAYCCPLVLEDLEDLHYKRYFNINPRQVALLPNPAEEIPLMFCMYLQKLPVAYAMGEISFDREAFELHFIETSNFNATTGLDAWFNYIISILVSLRDVLKTTNKGEINKICIMSPSRDSVEPLTAMGFDFINDYRKGFSAAVFDINTKVESSVER